MRKDLTYHMNLFRISSRELFNSLFFNLSRMGADSGSLDRENFKLIQEKLFHIIVLDKFSIENISYGYLNNQIRVVPRKEIDSIPLMINREIDSPYWDFDLKFLPRDSILNFICFFDWDEFGNKDNQYVRVKIQDCRENPEIIGKHALIEANFVAFSTVENFGGK